MISHKYKCIFIHQRKTAGSSIMHSFGIKPRTKNWRICNNGTLSDEWYETISRYPGYLIFAVVRNPWERFISGWKYLKGYKDKPLDYVLQNLPQSGKDYRHLARPQLDSLTDKQGNFVPDVVLRFESLSDDYQKFCELIGKPFTLDFHNRTQHCGITEYQTQEQIDQVHALFERDIKYFGYTFDNDIDTRPLDLGRATKKMDAINRKKNIWTDLLDRFKE